MLNNVTMVGRLVADPQLRQTQSGTQVASLRIANDDGYKNQNGEKNTLFIDVSVFGKQAEFVMKYFKKGSQIGVTGRLNQRKYVNKNNVEVTTFEIIANTVDFIDGKADGQQPASAPTDQSPIADSGNLDGFDVVGEEIPF